MPNRVRFDGRARRFYEVWYFIFNDPATGDGFWIRYTLLNPLDDHPEAGGALWFAHTCRADPERSFAIRRSFGRQDLAVSPGALDVRIGAATFTEGRLAGTFESGGHSVSWNLEYEPSPRPHYYFGETLRRLSARRTSVTVPNPQIHLNGELGIDGTSIRLRRAIGHQAHHWGIERAPRWLWGHCCAFDEDPAAVLELLAPEIGGIQLAFVSLYTAGETFQAMGLRSLLRNRATAGLGFWHFDAITAERRIIADVHVDPRYVQRFVYVSPSYRTSECWNTQVGDCLVRVYRGADLERVLRARGTACAETHDEQPQRIPYRSWSRDGSEQQ